MPRTSCAIFSLGICATLNIALSGCHAPITTETRASMESDYSCSSLTLNVTNMTDAPVQVFEYVPGPPRTSAKVVALVAARTTAALLVSGTRDRVYGVGHRGAVSDLLRGSGPDSRAALPDIEVTRRCNLLAQPMSVFDRS